MTDPVSGATAAPATPVAETDKKIDTEKKSPLFPSIKAVLPNENDKSFYMKIIKVAFAILSVPAAMIYDCLSGIYNWIVKEDTENEEPEPKPTPTSQSVKTRVVEFYNGHQKSLNAGAGIVASLGLAYFTGTPAFLFGV
ncbi:MAG: hypothetical protein K940chlam4_00362 [Candidatus Anoxychlamydiales bacterium]|nr:hypothetical protein [Candidatus Anoxychlamydiales bacterium]